MQPESSPLPRHPHPTPTDWLRRALFSRRARWLWVLFVALCTTFVLYMALAPRPQGPSFSWDKLNHVAAFAALAFGLLHALREKPRPVLWSTGLLLALGVGIELAQRYLPGREADWRDVLADALGIALGSLISATLDARLERRRQRRDASTTGDAPRSRSARA